MKTKDFAAALAERLDTEVLSHLQSGNFVVREAPPSTVEVAEEILRADFGVDVPAITRTVGELTQLLAALPWADAEPIRTHLAMWQGAHSEKTAAEMLQRDWGGDEIHFIGSNAWLHYATDFHRAKLGNHVIERQLKVVSTARNLKTIRDVLAKV